MLDASPTLHTKTTARNGSPYYRRVQFEGGFCVFSGGSSAINLASRSIKVLFADEIDKLRYSLRGEGEPRPEAAEHVGRFQGGVRIYADGQWRE
jgi:phage terminase large subunit GpA-like protein